MSRVRLQTELGDVCIALETEKAPISAANFIAYVEKKLFEGATFYRAMDKTEGGQRRALVQGGLIDLEDPAAAQARMLPAIVHEGPGDTGLKNTKGSVAYARLEPGTAQSEFFINLVDAPYFDELAEPEPPIDGLGYAVFGYVTEGLDVLEAMLKLECRPTPDIPPLDGQVLARPVSILSVEIESANATDSGIKQ